MEKTLPSERWARSRFYGEEFNCELRLHLAEALTRAGHPSVAPERLPDFGYRKSERFGLASNWSERHVAFVAGLGTFGLSDAMITRWGKAVRFGSVVSRIGLPVSRRVYGDDHHAWCLWYARGTCGACAKRCPADAITTTAGHDKQACFDYIRGITAPYATRTYGTGATPCGLCKMGAGIDRLINTVSYQVVNGWPHRPSEPSTAEASLKRVAGGMAWCIDVLCPDPSPPASTKIWPGAKTDLIAKPVDGIRRSER